MKFLFLFATYCFIFNEGHNVIQTQTVPTPSRTTNAPTTSSGLTGPVDHPATTSSVAGTTQSPTATSSLREETVNPATTSSFTGTTQTPTRTASHSEGTESPATTSSVAGTTQTPTSTASHREAIENPTTTGTVTGTTQTPTTTANHSERTENATTTATVTGTTQTPTRSPGLSEADRERIAAAIEKRKGKQRMEDPTRHCRTPGLTCLDDQTVIACVKQKNEWTIHTVQTCPDDDRCDKGKCTTDQATIAKVTLKDLEEDDIYPFLNCSKKGVFPHPYDCKRFLLCKPDLVPVHFMCPIQKGFNPKTLKCDVFLLSNQCDYNLMGSACTEPGETKAILHSLKNMYYICTKHETGILVPLIAKCNNAVALYDNFMCVTP